MKDVEIKLPKEGLALINCENGKVLDVVSPQYDKKGNVIFPHRIMFSKKTKSKWRHMLLKKDEFVCSLASLKDVVQMVITCDSNFPWL
ncbi:hypothetical protein LN032_03945 [Klebsiella pneumoniae]|nr:hypothetical protein [Klebsiella pneumoniae]